MKRALLHCEQLPGDQLNFKMNNSKDCARMIRAVMEVQQEAAAVFLTAVASFCHDKGIAWTEMQKIAEAHANK